MVVPVPVVLQQDMVRTVSSQLFATLDNYSSPRLVEYYDQNPCEPVIMYDSNISMKMEMAQSTSRGALEDEKDSYHVKIEAQYTVDEYDILILSAQESNGLERWLTDNGYKIPSGARDVLQPYINSGMKFFVVKVNTEELKKKGVTFLSPLQISFNSPKFMLPIRLGMVNAKGAQDMIVYTFTKTGRVETTNYRTVQVPTGNNVPEFIPNYFGQFYVDTYRKNRKDRGENNVYVEYAWNISGNVSQFCDPCNGPPPMLEDLMTAGVDWVGQYHYGYQGDVFFTRLHVTYDRKNFPQDLMFQETPNRENFQARYVIQHPVYGTFDCSEGKKYVSEVMQRRKDELNELAMLTGWDVSIYQGYLSSFNSYTPEQSPRYRTIKNESPKQIENPQSNDRRDKSSIDTGKIDQGSFSTPLYSDNDNNNNGNNFFGNLQKVAFGFIVVLMGILLLVELSGRKESTK